jgi:hypothetical protein
LTPQQQKQQQAQAAAAGLADKLTSSMMEQENSRNQGATTLTNDIRDSNNVGQLAGEGSSDRCITITSPGAQALQQSNLTPQQQKQQQAQAAAAGLAALHGFLVVRVGRTGGIQVSDLNRDWRSGLVESLHL